METIQIIRKCEAEMSQFNLKYRKELRNYIDCCVRKHPLQDTTDLA